ncbi:MAG TPA: glycosyltransferase family 2 protein [Candidatus Sulfotelmatobacter sp.]|nr:glycosyltransferase family 2 protein [Candidatus Sulfotelmatobacter sp.]
MISAIIPARNEEASITRAVESVAAQPEIAEVIVVDDQSSDRTGEILRGLASRIPKLRVLETRGLPTGWTGKNYAVSLGAAAAQGEWLLFTDADTFHYPGSARRALNDAVDHDAALVSYSPEQEVGTFWERALIPFVYCRLAAKFSYGAVNDPARPDAAANGQYLLVLRDVYTRLGGHAGVAGEILEDVALARRVKAAGYKIYFTAPIGVVRARMYRSFGAMWRGWTKNLYSLMGGSPGGIFSELARGSWIGLAVVLLPWIWFSRYTGVAGWYVGAGALAGLAILHYRYAIALYRNLYPVSYIRYFVPAECLYSLLLIVSWWKNARGSVEWKGRTYAVKSS